MTATTPLFSAPQPYLHPPYNKSSPSSSLVLSLPKTKTKTPAILRRASSPTSTSTTPKQEEEAEEDNSIAQQSTSISPGEGGCKACGKAEIERGCNGEGRMQGGIATVPGFGWWPIKAYRPCPGFLATGGRYRRQGQSMDEVAGFGNLPRTSSTTTTTKTQSSNKESSRKSKR